MIIAIDGPSGAGKSTVSKLVAKELGFSCLDTGAMYRCIAWKALEDGIDLENVEEVAASSATCEIRFVHDPGAVDARAVLANGVDVTSQIRTEQIDRAVSKVSAVPAVRTALVAQQQVIGRSGNYVVEGRDIGTVVFPDAAVKVFLTASNEERARRRVAQNLERGVGSTDFETVLADIVARDERDSARAASPLVAAEDARVIDSTSFSREEVVQMICDLAREAMKEGE